MPDAIVLATADAVLDDWREQIPEVNRAQLARVLLVTYASGGWAPRRDVEASARNTAEQIARSRGLLGAGEVVK